MSERDQGSLRLRHPRASAREARQAAQEARSALAALQAALPGFDAFLGALEGAQTLGDLWSWWEETYLVDRAAARTTRQWWRDYLAPELAQAHPKDVTPARLAALLRELDGKKAPRTVNGVRQTLKSLIRDARANGKWPWADPTDSVRARRVPRRRWPTLTAEEARWALRKAQAPYRAIFALMVFLGLRSGEVRALRREDVDAGERSIFVRRSNERGQTKTGRNRLLPIPRELWPFLAPVVLSAAPGELLFPGARGQLRRRDEKLAARLRAVLARAGVVDGWDRVCRGCKTRERFPTRTGEACSCGRAGLWVPVPRHLRAHDLRHTFNTLARRAGVSREVRRMTLGHAGAITEDYDQVTLEEHRKELEKVSLKPPARKTTGPSVAAEEPATAQSPERGPERERRFELPTRSLGSNGRQAARLTVAYGSARCSCGARAGFHFMPPDGIDADYCAGCFTRVLRAFRDGAR
jgi:integrase